MAKSTPQQRAVKQARQAQRIQRRANELKLVAGKTVHCPGCQAQQPDRGQGATCLRCGVSPIYSYAFPVASVWHPRNAGKPPR